MSLLPSRGPDTSTSQEGELQVVGVDDEVAPLLDALNSETARAILNEIYQDPGTPSEVADRLDMSIQKVSYHIEKLEDQELIDVAGTQYSEKGQEMTVYQPPDEPTVLFVGTEERKSSLVTMVKRLLPVVTVLALGGLVIEQLFGEGFSFGMASAPPDSTGAGGQSGGDAGSGSPDVAADGANASGTVTTETATETPTATPTATSTPSGDDDGGDIGVAEVTETETATEVETDTAAEFATETPTGTQYDATGATETPAPDPETTELARDTTAQATELAASGGLELSPGIAFFLGGVTVLAMLSVWWAYTNY